MNKYKRNYCILSWRRYKKYVFELVDPYEIDYDLMTSKESADNRKYFKSKRHMKRIQNLLY